MIKAAGVSLYHQAQRVVGKEIPTSRHEAGGASSNVLMKKLGLTSDTCPPDATSYQRFTDTFSSTLTTSHCDALDALLPSGLGSVFTEPEAPVLVS